MIDYMAVARRNSLAREALFGLGILCCDMELRHQPVYLVAIATGPSTRVGFVIAIRSPHKELGAAVCATTPRSKKTTRDRQSTMSTFTPQAKSADRIRARRAICGDASSGTSYWLLNLRPRAIEACRAKAPMGRSICVHRPDRRILCRARIRAPEAPTWLYLLAGSVCSL